MKTSLPRPTLVDTSGWVEFLRATNSSVDRLLAEALASNWLLWTTGVVLQEVLQGARNAG